MPGKSKLHLISFLVLIVLLCLSSFFVVLNFNYRIFSPKGIEIEEDAQPSPTDLEDTHPNKLNRGVLRSKIEAGEGTIPSSNLYNGKLVYYMMERLLYVYV